MEREERGGVREGGGKGGREEGRGGGGMIDRQVFLFVGGTQLFDGGMDRWRNGWMSVSVEEEKDEEGGELAGLINREV